jgi:hypothetical protein
VSGREGGLWGFGDGVVDLHPHERVVQSEGDLDRGVGVVERVGQQLGDHQQGGFGGFAIDVPFGQHGRRLLPDEGYVTV